MRPEPNIRIEPYRSVHPVLGSSPAGANWGCFEVDGLLVISSGHDDIHGWEHVSVSRPDWCPTWEEMCKVKDLFWAEDETVVQFHPKKAEYVKRHPFCLHLWRPIGKEIELPPQETVG